MFAPSKYIRVIRIIRIYSPLVRTDCSLNRLISRRGGDAGLRDGQKSNFTTLFVGATIDKTTMRFPDGLKRAASECLRPSTKAVMLLQSVPMYRALFDSVFQFCKHVGSRQTTIALYTPENPIITQTS